MSLLEGLTDEQARWVWAWIRSLAEDYGDDAELRRAVLDLHASGYDRQRLPAWETALLHLGYVEGQAAARAAGTEPVEELESMDDLDSVPW